MKVLVTDPIHEEGLNQLEKFADVETAYNLTKEELLEKIPDFKAMIVRSGTVVDKEVLDAAKNLKLVVRAGVGLDNIDLNYANKLGIKVDNTPKASTIAVSELVFGLMLSWARKIPQANQAMKNKRWIKSQLTGTELRDKTIGIIGTGRIGLEVARKAKAFEMEILGTDTIEKEEFREIGGEYTSLDTLLSNSDYVTIHVPLKPSTKDMIGENELEEMKETAVLINTSRGMVIDENALIKALKGKNIAGACLDTFKTDPTKNKELCELENVILTPHIGACTEEAQRDVSILAAKKVDLELLRQERNNSES